MALSSYTRCAAKANANNTTKADPSHLLQTVQYISTIDIYFYGFVNQMLPNQQSKEKIFNWKKDSLAADVIGP